MKGKKIAFWVVTAILALGLFASGAASVAGVEPIMTTMERLGYPAYFPRIIGIAKIAAAVALVSPRFPKVKEWAYAGSTFVLGGAVMSHLLAGGPIAMAAAPFVLLVATGASYQLRPEPRDIDAPFDSETELADVESEYGVHEGIQSSAV